MGAAGPDDIRVERLDAERAVVHVGQFALNARLDEHGVVWVEAEPAGVWLGFTRARTARQLAKRLGESGVLSASEFCCTVQQKGGERGRPAEQVWLTRSGLLKLAARSNTARAILVLDLIVRVFEAVLDGRPVAGARLHTDSRELAPPTPEELQQILRAELSRLPAAPTEAQLSRAIGHALDHTCLTVEGRADQLLRLARSAAASIAKATGCTPDEARSLAFQQGAMFAGCAGMQLGETDLPTHFRFVAALRMLHDTYAEMPAAKPRQLSIPHTDATLRAPNLRSLTIVGEQGPGGGDGGSQ